MPSITIHNLDIELYKSLKQKADAHELSLNKLIKRILTSSLGLNSKSQKADFSEFANSWSDLEFQEFAQSQSDFTKIKDDEWK
jgi:plasmid stability protein